ncbi:hypothetical protein G9A89_004056 [Geosiphon pyriformis]|nr:hypothetical protein G9A89_004056 [Geosiphon pyriformis]
MLEERRRKAATHIEHFQTQQKEWHNNKLPLVTNNFKVGNKVFLYRTKAEKQWSGKFENKWDGPFFIYEILGNKSYKLRLDNKILAKVAHRDRLKHYHSRNNPKPLIPQIGTHSLIVNPKDILQNLEPIVVIEQPSYSGIYLPELLKLALRENLMSIPISIPPNAIIQQKLQLSANLTKEAIQKQLHNEFKTTAGPTNSHYKLRTALKLYDLFYTCKNVLQNPILQSLKIQYIGKLTELKFQQFSDQISSIILDYYLEITDSTWTSTELSLEEEVMLLDEIRDTV